MQHFFFKWAEKNLSANVDNLIIQTRRLCNGYVSIWMWKPVTNVFLISGSNLFFSHIHVTLPHVTKIENVSYNVCVCNLQWSYLSNILREAAFYHMESDHSGLYFQIDRITNVKSLKAMAKIWHLAVSAGSAAGITMPALTPLFPKVSLSETYRRSLLVNFNRITNLTWMYCFFLLQCCWSWCCVYIDFALARPKNFLLLL